MRVDWQQRFVQHWFSEQRYQQFRQQLDKRVGTAVEFRVCEAPIFLSQSTRQRLAQLAIEIAQQCVEPSYLEKTESVLPPNYRVPGAEQYPLFIVVDFAVVEDPHQQFDFKVVELQGFPSLFGYQYELAKAYIDAYQLPADQLELFYESIKDQQYWQWLRTAIVANHDPKEVVILEFQPYQQKTLPDFTALQRHLGIAIVDILEVEQRHNQLFYRDAEGKTIRIRRIMNRAIVEELEAAGITMPSWWTCDLDVEWAGHPNWYFRISKYTLPFLQHPAVPTTMFLDQVTQLPDDLSQYVLKPLFAFAGRGVKVNLRPEDILQIPPDQRAYYVLQEKLTYASWMPTPVGKNKTEIRVMLLWLPDWEQPRALIPLVRTGRAAMMGVSYNDMPWAGSSTALFPTL